MNRSVFITWQDGASRHWFVIGELAFDGSQYRFAYTKGAKRAQRVAGFEPLIAFPSFDLTYTSAELFPLFANRVLRKTRPEYQEQLRYLDLTVDEADEFEVLRRSSGFKVTDSLEVIARPEETPDGHYELPFFVRGVRYLAPDVQTAICKLRTGERLYLLKDVQNAYNTSALALRTDQKGRQDLVGYCPDYYVQDIHELLSADAEQTIVTVEAVNPPPAPEQFRLRCVLRAPKPVTFTPFAGEDYHLLTPLPAYGHAST